jgi:hypothetical protein
VEQSLTTQTNRLERDQKKKETKIQVRKISQQGEINKEI